MPILIKILRSCFVRGTFQVFCLFLFSILVSSGFPSFLFYEVSFKRIYVLQRNCAAMINIGMVMAENKVDNIMLAVPKNHRLFRRKNILAADLLEENFISLNALWSLEQMIQKACSRKGFAPNVLIRVDNPDLLRLLVEKIGLAFVPEKTWGKSFSRGEFDLRPVADLSIKRYVYVVWKEGFVRENVRECIHCIEDFFSESIS